MKWITTVLHKDNISICSNENDQCAIKSLGGVPSEIPLPWKENHKEIGKICMDIFKKQIIKLKIMLLFPIITVTIPITVDI